MMIKQQAEDLKKELKRKYQFYEDLPVNRGVFEEVKNKMKVIVEYCEDVIPKLKERFRPEYEDVVADLKELVK